MGLTAGLKPRGYEKRGHSPGSLPRFVSIRHPREIGDPEFPVSYGLPLARE
jgi:hypothetical protein